MRLLVLAIFWAAMLAYVVHPETAVINAHMRELMAVLAQAKR